MTKWEAKGAGCATPSTSACTSRTAACIPTNSQQESDSGKKQLLVVGLRTSRGEFERNYEAFKEPVWILAYVLYFAFSW